jgi:hypothetical protein
MIDLKRLSEFLNEANENMYAADGRRIKSTRLESRDLEFKKGDLVCHDTYFGNKNFIGEEVVYEKDSPVWGVNYFGFIIDRKFSADQVYGFLKKALLQEYNDIIPVRGPKSFKESDFEYMNVVDGDLRCFTGKEEILFKGKIIYRAFYHGGLIIGKD